MAWFAVLVLAWPPFVPFAITSTEAAHHTGQSEETGTGHHAAADRDQGYTDIPGTPGHPLDHDCAPCQILKHLAHSLVQSQPGPARPDPVSEIALDDKIQPQHGGIVVLPQSRAPPAFA